MIETTNDNGHGKQPFATASNWIYILLGIVALILSPAEAKLFAFVMIGLGVSSHEFHRDGARKNTPWHVADLIGVYAILLVVLTQSWNLSPIVQHSVLVLSAVSLPFLGTNTRNLDTFQVGPIIAILALIGMWFTTPWQWALGFTLSALVLYLVDKQWPKLREGDFSHGIFHIVTGLAAFLNWIVTNDLVSELLNIFR